MAFTEQQTDDACTGKDKMTTTDSSTLQGHRKCSLGTGRRRQSSHCGKQTGMMRMWEAATLCSISRQS